MLSNYQEPGERNIFWLTDNVIKYHRTFSQIINGLIDNRFEINKVLEPKPVRMYSQTLFFNYKSIKEMLVNIIYII